MEVRTFDDLVLYMNQRRRLGYHPPVLLLGAGASFEAGVGTMKQLFQFTKVKDFDEFCQYIKTRSADERYIHLSEFLQTRKPADVTPGYRALAALLAENYFDLILSTNFDPLLEDALADARLWRKDYLLLVNGIVRPERLDVILKEPSPRVKIIKLHGDLFHRYMAWTPQEMEAFVKDIRPQLTPILYGRDIFIAGYSMNDKPIRELVVEAGGPNSAIWYLHPAEVPESLKANDRVRAVLGPECKFEELFTRLAKALDVEQAASASHQRAHQAAPEKAAGKGRTIDDLMASVVGLIPIDGSWKAPVCTGFVLSEPRLIVTEGFSGNRFKGDAAKVVTADKRSLDCRIVRRDETHPFAPILFDVPEGLNAPGLRLDASPLTANLAVRVGVAAGERVGISSGSIVEIDEKRLPIAPVGEIDHLVAVDCVVAPGSAGAPVLDAASLAVRGYIVAGSTDKPPSFMYPAYRWADAVRAKPSRQNGRRTRGGRARR
ncbi:MAG: SIR2 family protein [Pyrinomonadaceae bacterium]|nr:SIR2 family protein [Pyrinomonadaceae bacterium]